MESDSKTNDLERTMPAKTGAGKPERAVLLVIGRGLELCEECSMMKSVLLKYQW